MEAVIAIVSAVVAVISAIIAFFQARKNWYIETITTQRLVWAENLRKSLQELITDYYARAEDMAAKVNCIMLYLNPKNKYQFKLISALNNLNAENESTLKEVVKQAQELLRFNWWTVKAESTVSYAAELRRDKKVEKRLEYYQQKETP